MKTKRAASTKLVRGAARGRPQPLSVNDPVKRKDQLDAAHAKYAPTLGDRLTAMQAGEYYQFLPPIPFATIRALVYSWMQGNFTAMWDVISVMLDTWPMFLENQHALRDSVAQTKFLAKPFSVAGQEPTASAQKKAAEFNAALGAFDPTPGTDEKDLRGTVYHSANALVMPTWQYVLWQRSMGQFAPRATVWVHTRFLGFDGAGRFGFRMTADPAATGPVDDSLHYPGAMAEPEYSAVVPPNRGLCSVYDTRSGSITMSGLVRPLTRYWGGMYYGYQWMLRYAEMFGQPARIAYYDPNLNPADLAKLDDFLQNMGANPWARLPNGAKLDWFDFKGGAGHEDPKRWLQSGADEFCHLLHFGETGTSSFGQKGSGSGKAHGEVMERTRRKREEGVASWEASVLRQLARSWNILNYGTADETPILFPEDTTPLPPSEQADTIQKLDASGWEVADDDADPETINQTMQEKFAMPLVRKPAPEPVTPTEPFNSRVAAAEVKAYMARQKMLRAHSASAPTTAAAADEKLHAATLRLVVAARREALSPLRPFLPIFLKLQAALALHDDADRAAAVAALRLELEHFQQQAPALLKEMNASHATAEMATAIADGNAAAFWNALADAAKQSTARRPSGAATTETP